MEQNERLATVESLVGRVAADIRQILHDLEGDGKQGIKVRLDRLEQESSRRGRALVVVLTILVPIAIKVGYDWLVQFIRGVSP